MIEYREAIRCWPIRSGSTSQSCRHGSRQYQRGCKNGQIPTGQYGADVAGIRAQNSHPPGLSHERCESPGSLYQKSDQRRADGHSGILRLWQFARFFDDQSTPFCERIGWTWQSFTSLSTVIKQQKLIRNIALKKLNIIAGKLGPSLSPNWSKVFTTWTWEYRARILPTRLQPNKLVVMTMQIVSLAIGCPVARKRKHLAARSCALTTWWNGRIRSLVEWTIWPNERFLLFCIRKRGQSKFTDNLY